MELQEVSIHGRRVAYRTAGAGQTVVLLHGITQQSATWDRVGRRLAAHVRVIAPDLPGHGASEEPAGDHSLGSYASTVRDLLYALESPGATIVGHSLGGGVALQFAYQFPELTERLVLIDSGGLGEDVSLALRAATLPGADLVLALASTHGFVTAAGSLATGLRKLGLRAGTDLSEGLQGVAGLADPRARRAFLRTVDSVIGLRGQRVSAADRLYLAAHVPTLIVWGSQDRIIPPHHGHEAHQAIEGSRLVVLPGVGHFPHHDAPDETAAALIEFFTSTDPAEVSTERWGELLRAGDPRAERAEREAG